MLLFSISQSGDIFNRIGAIGDSTNCCEASSIGDTFPLKRAVKGRCGDFRSKAKKILPDLDCGSLSV